jgi:hypothetical protein
VPIRIAGPTYAGDPMKPPRRTFAAPFVVTVGLAGCTHFEDVQPVRPPVPRDAAVVVTVPPPPEPTPPPVDLGEYLKEPDPNVITDTVVRYGKACTLQYNMHCPPGARCNPPRPHDYACPAGMTTERATIRVQRDTASCMLESELEVCMDPAGCPKPPPPRKIPCP